MPAHDATLGLAIIARDEQDTLPRLLASVSGCFDRVALLDTGSTDATVAVFEDWAVREAAAFPGFGARIGFARWRDDFAAARNAADALLGTDWRAWADADDEIDGANELRALVARAPDDLAAFAVRYEIAQTRGGSTLWHSQRVRLTRAGAAHWRWPVHEQLVVDGTIAEIPRETVRWVHHKDEAGAPAARERNLRILRHWLERDPDNPRALSHAGREEALAGNHAEAVVYFRRFLAVAGDTTDESAQIHRLLATSLIALGRLDAAAEDAARALAARPDFADAHLTLAEVALAAGDPQRAIAHAREALRRGARETPLLQAETDYTAHPHLLIARALQLEGDHEAARRAAAEALGAL